DEIRVSWELLRELRKERVPRPLERVDLRRQIRIDGAQSGARSDQHGLERGDLGCGILLATSEILEDRRAGGAASQSAQERALHGPTACPVCHTEALGHRIVVGRLAQQVHVLREDPRLLLRALTRARVLLVRPRLLTEEDGRSLLKLAERSAPVALAG